jgi:hypothetical protein
MNGVVTFTGVSIDRAGIGYKLSASAPGLTTVTSTSFDVTAFDLGLTGGVSDPWSNAAGSRIARSGVTVASRRSTR